MKARYEFLTEWSLKAPLEAVWEALHHTERWPQWWKGSLRVEELEAGDSLGIGSLRRFVWRGALPYTLIVDLRVTRVEKFRLIEAFACGELQGTGLWLLSQASGCTRVRYHWKVFTTRWWMNLLAPIARPLFRWNHDVVMRRGEEGLKKLLHLQPDRWPDRHPG